MVKAMEDMANSTQLRFKQRAGTPNHQTLLLFVSSVARTNLEAELVQRGGTLAASVSRYKPRQDCIGIYLFYTFVFVNFSMFV